MPIKALGFEPPLEAFDKLSSNILSLGSMDYINFYVTFCALQSSISSSIYKKSEIFHKMLSNK